MSTLAEVPPSTKTRREVIERAVIRFAGDSGDGMQITGSQFTNTVALYGNDIATFPDYPAEIRAPAGTIPGVSGFQLHFSSNEVFTPGDAIDALIAMNPAALKVNVADLKANGILIVNRDSFKESDLRKAQMTVSPLEDHSLDKFRVFPVELQRQGARLLGNFEATAARGYYEVTARGTRPDRPASATLGFAVNLAPQESDFRRIDKAGLEKVLTTSRKVWDLILEKTMERIEALDVEAEARRLSGSSGNSPGSSESTPARLRSVS